MTPKTETLFEYNVRSKKVLVQILQQTLCELDIHSNNMWLDVPAIIGDRFRAVLKVSFASNVVRAESTAHIVERVVVPADWWQAVRARWWPAFWLKWYPVKQTTHPVSLSTEIKFVKNCPHLRKPEGDHYAFLVKDDIGVLGRRDDGGL